MKRLKLRERQRTARRPRRVRVRRRAPDPIAGWLVSGAVAYAVVKFARRVFATEGMQ